MPSQNMVTSHPSQYKISIAIEMNISDVSIRRESSEASHIESVFFSETE
jgi:hypothetical protein